MRELLKNILPSLLLLSLVDACRDEGYETTPPHARATGDNVGGKSRTGMMNKLSRGVEALAAVTEEAGGIGLSVEIKKESSIDHSQTAMENIKTVLQLNCKERHKSQCQNGVYIEQSRAVLTGLSFVDAWRVTLTGVC